MKIVKTIAVLGMPPRSRWQTNEARAEPCNGHVVSKALPSILMREAPDGSKVIWVSSEGLFVVSTNPKTTPRTGSTGSVVAV